MSPKTHVQYATKVVRVSQGDEVLVTLKESGRSVRNYENEDAAWNGMG
jgi:hypothetical protein